MNVPARTGSPRVHTLDAFRWPFSARSHAEAHAAVHAPESRIIKDGCELGALRGTRLHALQFREDSQEGWHEVMVDGKAEGWMGFACKECGTPSAVQRSDDASKSGEHSARGWACDLYRLWDDRLYEPGTPMVRITVSN